MEDLYHESWKPILTPLFAEERIKNLFSFVESERRDFDVFPSESFVFNAFKLTPFESVKVVILGQDPYHNIGQAHGLSFSVPDDVAFPPSLKNIFIELSSDIEGFVIPNSGDLTSWAKQGVLLLNSILTVRAHQAGSHQKRGWEYFTDCIIREISSRNENVVFILWGAYAQKKSSLIDQSKHLIIKSAHPSPLSVYRGFWGSRPFSKSNCYLMENQRGVVEWSLG